MYYFITFVVLVTNVIEFINRKLLFVVASNFGYSLELGLELLLDSFFL